MTGHPAERLAKFAERGADDHPEDWVPMWIMRSVALRLLGASDSDEWTHDDNELNQALHEWLEKEAGKREEQLVENWTPEQYQAAAARRFWREKGLLS